MTNAYKAELDWAHFTLDHWVVPRESPEDGTELNLSQRIDKLGFKYFAEKNELLKKIEELESTIAAYKQFDTFLLAHGVDLSKTEKRNA